MEARKDELRALTSMIFIPIRVAALRRAILRWGTIQFFFFDPWCFPPSRYVILAACGGGYYGVMVWGLRMHGVESSFVLKILFQLWKEKRFIFVLPT